MDATSPDAMAESIATISRSLDEVESIYFLDAMETIADEMDTNRAGMNLGPMDLHGLSAHELRELAWTIRSVKH
ncbi:MAG: hypothetical protein AAGG50_03835 [Bacteroidota bacterium]